MKICAIICEFNPFHNGHKYILDKARELSGCDALICIMSGSFTQRGNICVIDKFLRAKHAVVCGADCILELPTAFSVAPAEIFAKGAVKILSSVPEIDTLAFGCESGSEADFLSAAKILSDESGNFKEALKKSLDTGESYAKKLRLCVRSCRRRGGLPIHPQQYFRGRICKGGSKFEEKYQASARTARGRGF